MKKVILLALLFPALAWGQPNDYGLAGIVIITEIMADPLPQAGLPPREYLEILNRSDSEVDLAGWRYYSGESEVAFPAIIIAAGEYLILCHENYVADFLAYGKCAGLKQFPVLTDAGKMLRLVDQSGKLIHGVEYSDKWYDQKLRSDGGWSLEMVDISCPFYGEGNWKASRALKGGTPGSVNSVSGSNRDDGFHGLKNAFPSGPGEILLSFSEPLLNLESEYLKIAINGRQVIRIRQVDELYRSFIVEPGEAMIKGVVYNLCIESSVCDFEGNPIERREFRFGIPSSPVKGNILFNELLFNPVGGGSDYIEFVNVSGIVIDAASLFVVSVNSTGDTSKLYPVSEEHRCIMPGGYYAITTDYDELVTHYPGCDKDYCFEVASMASMNNDEGNLILLTRELEIIDEVKYNEGMHFSLLSGYEGIALEKSGPSNSSLDRFSWHSASESAGWGTPGKRNSIFPESSVDNGQVSFSSTKISPDSDGYEDFLSVHLSLPGQGNVASIDVFDENGSHVRRLASNMLIGTEADIIWDGTSDDGSLVERGIYIILVSVYNDIGKTYRWKKACAVVRR